MKDWFPHDYHATKDLAVIRLIMKHGSRGYGCFWLCTELLHANDVVTLQALHDVFLHTFNDLSSEQCIELLDDMIKCGLLKTTPLDDEEDPEVYSDRVLRNKEERSLITEHKRRAAQTRWNQKNARALQEDSTSNPSAMLLHNITRHDNTIHQEDILDPSVIQFDCIAQKVFHVKQSELDQMIQLYPNVDIIAELRKMKGWLLANKTKRKTMKGMPRFVHNWLGKAQDNGKHQHTTTKHGSKIGERSNNFTTTEYDDQIRSIAESAIRSAHHSNDQTVVAIRQTSQKN